MTIRQSLGLRNHLQSSGSFRSAFNGGKLEVRSGSQPATADLAPTGTLLVTFTVSSGAHTAEVRATGTATLAGSAGSITGMTVAGRELMSGSVAFDTSLTVTAAAVAANINRNSKAGHWKASSSGAVVTITAPVGDGAAWNSIGTLITTGTGGLTSTDVNVGTAVAGVDSVNGLKFEPASAGSLVKLASQTWTGVVANSGTAGWFRLKGPVADNDSDDTTNNLFARLDGSVAVSGADMNLTSTTLTAAATETLASFTPTEPAQ